jgi:hypothetical protein
VLFGFNDKGEVDPTMPVYPENGKEFKEHHIPGLEHLASGDLVIFFPRLLTLPMPERELIVQYLDSGKPIISIRTGNHGFHAALPYWIKGKQVDWGNDVLGGTFMGRRRQPAKTLREAASGAGVPIMAGQAGGGDRCLPAGFHLA